MPTPKPPPIAHIGAYDAKARLSALLDRVERGEEIVITRHNRPIARLIPEGPGQNVAAARAAIAGLTRLRESLALKEIRLTPAEIRAMRDEGRR
jgi:prevent-host-death family protein